MSEIERIETLTDEELDTELRKFGVDPKALIESTFQKVCEVLKAKSERLTELERAADEMEKALNGYRNQCSKVDNCETVPGCCCFECTHADAALASYAKWKEK